MILGQCNTDDEAFCSYAVLMLSSDEGRHQYLYSDATGKRVTLKTGKITIGIGRNVDEIGLSPDEILYLFRNDLRNAVAACYSVLGEQFYESLDTVRKLALVNMAFQLGRSGFGGFKNTIKLIRTEQWDRVYIEGKDSDWYRFDTPVRAERVLLMLKTGMFPY